MRLELRPWSDSDGPALIEAYQDPELQRWTSFHVPDEAAAKEWLAFQRSGWDAGTRFSLVVESDSVLVGNVALKAARLAEGVGEVGYWTAPWARRRGVASTAVIALSRWAFATFSVSRLELRHLVANTASCRVAARAGFALTAEPEGGHVHTQASP